MSPHSLGAPYVPRSYAEYLAARVYVRPAWLQNQPLPLPANDTVVLARDGRFVALDRLIARATLHPLGLSNVIDAIEEARRERGLFDVPVVIVAGDSRAFCVWASAVPLATAWGTC